MCKAHISHQHIGDHEVSSAGAYGAQINTYKHSYKKTSSTSWPFTAFSVVQSNSS